MPDNEYPAEMESLIEKLEDRHTPPSVQYALLAEMATLADAADSMAALESYLYIGGSYHALGHYLFALTAYDKAMALLPKCGDGVSDDEDLAEELYEGFTNMLDIYRKMKKPQAEANFLALVQEIMPDSFDTIKNSKGSRLRSRVHSLTKARKELKCTHEEVRIYRDKLSVRFDGQRVGTHRTIF
jgi:tetratricopeptide (TPR) repeat protein